MCALSKILDTKCVVKLYVEINKIVFKVLNAKIRCSYFPIVMDLIYITTSLSFTTSPPQSCWPRIATNKGKNQTNPFDLA